MLKVNVIGIGPGNPDLLTRHRGKHDPGRR